METGSLLPLDASLPSHHESAGFVGDLHHLPGSGRKRPPETDSLYIELSEEPGVETREVSDGVNVDIDARGKLVGFDIDRALNQLDLSSLETTALPLRTYRIG